MLALTVLAILAAVAVPTYTRYRERAAVAQAIADISTIDLSIQRFETQNMRLPASLADVGFGGQLDPWGRPYVYLNIADVMGLGAVRKDRNLVPVNSDFDLYSAGKDGASQPPLTARASADDVLRANDGTFIGLAKDY
jgi:general secretion pathway protein G